MDKLNLHSQRHSKNNHGNLTLNNFVKATIFAAMIVHIGTLDFINSNAFFDRKYYESDICGLCRNHGYHNNIDQSVEIVSCASE